MTEQRPSNSILTFAEFRKANVTRCVKWHPQGINSWSPSDWLTAVTGELGELASLLKMRNRERDGLPGNKFSPTRKQIADELADVLTYLDLLAEALDVDLASAAIEKFNEVSERVGFPDRLRLTDEPPAVPPFEFDRYVDGKLKAEGVVINRAETFEQACLKAVALATPGSVLVVRTTQPPNVLRPGLERAIEIVSKADLELDIYQAFRDRLVAKLDAAIGENEHTGFGEPYSEDGEMLKDCLTCGSTKVASFRRAAVTKEGNQAEASSQGDVDAAPMPRRSLPNSLGASHEKPEQHCGYPGCFISRAPNSKLCAKHTPDETSDGK